ncbi:MAG: prohibitin family protein [Clostridia bacterium]|nr:prohibitin family protein [Clostridia bacterium]
MNIGIIFGGVFVALTVGFVALAYMFVSKKRKKGLGVACGVLALIMLLGLLIVPSSFRTVETGEIVVVKHLGEATEVRTAGMHFDLWLTNTYQRYDAKVQNVDIDTMAYSSDAQTMNIKITLQYQIVVDKALDIAKQYGTLDVLQSRIQSIAIEKTKAVLSAYKAMDIISDRAAMSPAVEKAINDAVGEEYFVDITAVVLTNIDFSDAFEQAVEEKMIAEQAKLKAEYENETKIAQAKAEADAQVEKAKAKIEIAKAEAEAVKIAAEAEANANEIIMKSLSPEIIEKLLADKWNGKLPTVVGSGEYILPSDIFGAAENAESSENSEG